MSGISVVILFMLLLLIGMPIAYVMLFSSGLFFLTNGLNLSVMVQKMGVSLNSISTIAIPMFIFAGIVMNHVNLSDSMFNGILATPIGKMKGGLAQVNIIASLAFGAMSGAALADIGGLGVIEIDIMTKKGYKMEDALGITLSSSAIGPIFPPSVPLMLYSLYAEQSGIVMLTAGIVPALLFVAILMVTVSIIARKRGWPVHPFNGTKKEQIKILVRAIPAFLIPLILLGGMYSGKFATSELASIAVVASLIVGFLFYKGVNFHRLKAAAKESIGNISAMMLIIGGASLFAQVISRSGIPDMITNLVLTMNMPPVVVLLIINVVFLFIGMLMDSNIAIIIFTPMLLPAMVTMGVDPVHFGVMVCINVVIGIFTPPFGTALFLGQAISGLSFKKVVEGVKPYYVPLLILLLLVTLVPQVSTWLPSVLFG